MPSHLWTPAAPLSLGPAIGSPGGTHPLAADGDLVHAVWAWAGNLHYRCSSDAGRTWADPSPLVTSGAAEYPCSLELHDSLLHLIWPDRRHDSWEVYYRRSEDRGQTWGEDTRLTPGVHLFRPGTALSGNNLHIVWGSNRLLNPTPSGNHTWGEIYHKCSLDAGESWEPTLRLTAPDATAMRPAVAAVGDLVHVTYFDRRDSHLDWDWDLYYRRSLDGGRTWEPELRVTHTPTHLRHPAVVADPHGRVCCLWEDGQLFDGRTWAGDAALYAAVSEDHGATWGETRRLTFINAPHSWATHCKTYAYGSRVHLAWADSPEGSDQPHSAYYMTSPDCGLTWEAPERLTHPTDGPCWAAGVAGTDSYAVVSLAPEDTLHYRRRDLGPAP